MFGKVKVGEKEIEMCANAATPVRYRQVFGKNILTYLMGKAEEEESTAMIPELAYVMTMSAEGADMNKLSFDGYLKWLEDFNGMDFVEEKTVRAIMALYQGNELPNAKSKKKADQ